MRKRSLAVGLTLLLSMVVLTGCSDSKKDYENDVKELTAYSDFDSDESDSLEEMVSDMKKLVKDLKMETTQGKELKESLKELVDVTGEMVDTMMKNPQDTDGLDKLSDKMQDISDEAKKDLDSFKKAAKEAGVEEKQLKNLDVGQE